MFFFLFLCGVSPIFSDAAPPSSAKPLIFIDAGHGGKDIGAWGIGGVVEKAVTLRLAKLLSERLAGAYKVKLSREDDYYLDAFSRTGAANEMSAALMISLHLGGSFRRRAEGMHLFYYETLKKRVFTGPMAMAAPFDLEGAEPWRRVQLKHVSESRRLARLLRNHLTGVSAVRTTIAGADALVLAGADMPAILLEFGCLSHPDEEKKLREKDYLEKIAEAIRVGIAAYFQSRSAVSSMDLHQ